MGCFPRAHEPMPMPMPGDDFGSVCGGHLAAPIATCKFCMPRTDRSRHQYSCTPRKCRPLLKRSTTHSLLPHTPHCPRHSSRPHQTPPAPAVAERAASGASTTEATRDCERETITIYAFDSRCSLLIAAPRAALPAQRDSKPPTCAMPPPQRPSVRLLRPSKWRVPALCRVAPLLPRRPVTELPSPPPLRPHLSLRRCRFFFCLFLSWFTSKLQAYQSRPILSNLLPALAKHLLPHAQTTSLPYPLPNPCLRSTKHTCHRRQSFMSVLAQPWASSPRRVSIPHHLHSPNSRICRRRRGSRSRFERLLFLRPSLTLPLRIHP